MDLFLNTHLSNLGYETKKQHVEIAKYLTISLGSIGFILNAITLLALCFVKKQALGPHLLLLRNLTLADFLVAIQLVLEKLPLPIDDCVRDALFAPCSPLYTTTYLTLLLIAANLYIAVVHPLRHNGLVTYRRTTVAVVMCWVFGFGDSGSSALIYSQHWLMSLDSVTQCTFTVEQPSHTWKTSPGLGRCLWGLSTVDWWSVLCCTSGFTWQPEEVFNLYRVCPHPSCPTARRRGNQSTRHCCSSVPSWPCPSRSASRTHSCRHTTRHLSAITKTTSITIGKIQMEIYHMRLISLLKITGHKLGKLKMTPNCYSWHTQSPYLS